MSLVANFKRSFWLLLLFSFSLSAYKFYGGDYFFGAGFGANVNVVRFVDVGGKKPMADMPLLFKFDYAIDQNLGVFADFVPQFSTSCMTFGLRAGAKYWMSFLNAPYFPFLSLAISPSFLVPLKDASTHFNLGITPGFGMSFFLMAKLLIGAQVNFNPSVVFVDKKRKFEFSVMSFFDIALRI